MCISAAASGAGAIWDSRLWQGQQKYKREIKSSVHAYSRTWSGAFVLMYACTDSFEFSLNFEGIPLPRSARGKSILVISVKNIIRQYAITLIRELRKRVMFSLIDSLSHGFGRNNAKP